MFLRQYRVAIGVGSVFAGVVVAVLGYLGVSRETEVAFQLPYFASAGVGALMLLGFGAAVLFTSQFESEADRLDDLEQAVRQLSSEVARLADELTPVRGNGGNGHPAKQETPRGRARAGSKAESR
ncbi:MAG: hypothetical protein WDA71_11945 [Actinomycetota bacterium]